MITPKDIMQLVVNNQLFSSIEIQDNNVILHLNEKYDTYEYHGAINNWLCQIYKNCEDFHEKFEKTYLGTFKPCLTLKEGHGYKDGGDIQQSLIDFSTIALAPKIKILELIARGEVISDIKILNKKHIELILDKKYDNKELYLVINRSLHNLHKSLSPFNTFFLRPKINDSKPILTLKPEYEDKSKDELITLLNYIFNGSSSGMSAIPLQPHTETYNPAQISTTADTSVSVISSFMHDPNKNVVNLILCDQFNNKIFFRPINNLLEKYKESDEFRLDFKDPRRGNHRPYLILKKNHQMQRAFITLNNIITSIKADNINFDDEVDAIPLLIPETLDSRAQESTAALNQDSQDNASSNPWPLSLSGFNTFVDNLRVAQQGTPYLPTYNEEELAEALEPISREAASVSIFSSSQAEFTVDDAQEDTHSQTTFELLPIDQELEQTQNQQTNDTQYALTPSLIEENRQGQIPFAQASLHNTSNQPIPFAIQKMILNGLMQGKLLQGVTAHRDNCLSLHLTCEYDKNEYYYAINRAFNLIYQISIDFQKMFEQPNQDNHHPYLILKTPRTYKKGVLKGLIRTALTSHFAALSQSIQQTEFPQFNANAENSFQSVESSILDAFSGSTKRKQGQIDDQSAYQPQTTLPLDDQSNEHLTRCNLKTG